METTVMVYIYRAFQGPIVENPMEKKMDNEMEAGVILGIKLRHMFRGICLAVLKKRRGGVLLHIRGPHNPDSGVSQKGGVLGECMGIK